MVLTRFDSAWFDFILLKTVFNPLAAMEMATSDDDDVYEQYAQFDLVRNQ